MEETFQKYRKRILGYLGKKDPLRVQRATPEKLARLLRGASLKRLSQRPAPGKWSVVEILAHLADAELALAWRIRTMLARSGTRLLWFDQDKWAAQFHYKRRNPQKSLQLFRALRESNLALLRSVPRRKWKSCFGVHEVRGRQTVADFVVLEAAHDLNHLLQIRRILRRN